MNKKFLITLPEKIAGILEENYKLNHLSKSDYISYLIKKDNKVRKQKKED